jgi:hypothetical protein
MQPHAEAHPSDPVNQEVDAEQGPQNINAVERPVTDDNQTKQDRDRRGDKDKPARLASGELRGQIGANQARREKTGAEQKRQHDRSKQRVGDAQNAGRHIEHASPKERIGPIPANACRCRFPPRPR